MAADEGPASPPPAIRVHSHDRYEAQAGKYWDMFYRRNTTKFFKDRHYLHKEFPDLAAGPATLLEVGCGVGNTVFPLLEINPALRVHCCDFATSAIELVRSNPAYGVSRPEGAGAVRRVWRAGGGRMAAEEVVGLFASAGFSCDAVTLHERTVVNHKRDIAMDRRWLQAVAGAVAAADPVLPGGLTPGSWLTGAAGRLASHLAAGPGALAAPPAELALARLLASSPRLLSGRCGVPSGLGQTGFGSSMSAATAAAAAPPPACCGSLPAMAAVRGGGCRRVVVTDPCREGLAASAADLRRNAHRLVIERLRLAALDWAALGSSSTAGVAGTAATGAAGYTFVTGAVRQLRDVMQLQPQGPTPRPYKQQIQTPKLNPPPTQPGQQ
eukprot:XP_001697714.1 predicted protein [Chlamydomonas reinhardtii]